MLTMVAEEPADVCYDEIRKTTKSQEKLELTAVGGIKDACVGRAYKHGSGGYTQEEQHFRGLFLTDQRLVVQLAFLWD